MKRLQVTMAAVVLLFGGAMARADEQSDMLAVVEKAIKAQGGADELAKDQAGTVKMTGKFYGLGEGIPFMLPRINRNLTPQITKLARPVGAYLRENVHYTFAGFNFQATFLDLLLEVGVERIMFSADHPYGSMAEARAFLDHIPVSPADRERIAHGNAERLLKL